jgi:hypothetical protein
MAMSFVLHQLVGKTLTSVKRREFDSIITFSDRSTIIAYVSWDWVCGQKLIPMDFSLEKILERNDGLDLGSLCVTGVTFYVDSLALRVHFNGTWGLQIQPIDPLPVAWVLCLASQRIVTAGGGALSVYEKA